MTAASRARACSTSGKVSRKMANRDAGGAKRGKSMSRSNLVGNPSRRSEPSAAQSENNPSASVASSNAGAGRSMAVNNNSTLARWPLAKYANLIASKTLATPGSGTWQERCSARLLNHQQPDDMWIQITQRRYVQILHGDVLLESCTLSSAKEEWRAIRKGPNMLFVVTKKGTSRKFRIRFLHRSDEYQEGTKTTKDDDASATAELCARHLSCYFTIYDADRQGQVGVARTEDANSQLPPCQVSLQELSRAVIKHQAKWPPGCIGRDVAHESIPDLVHSCLMDPSFPGFVEAIEKSLKSLTTPCPDDDPASQDAF